MSERTLIVHGWSDSSSSFAHVEEFLAGNGVGPVEDIYFGDYDSQEDHLRFYDVAEGLHKRMYEKGFIHADGSKKVDLNVLVHSTGGPVIRHWIWRYYLRDGNRIEQCPINRLLMLAPANFGSPLAHYGKSFLGSLAQGKWELDDMLEVGKNLLSGLELASPYQWKLAHRDLIQPEAPYRPSPEKIQTTVLVGNAKYEGFFRQYVNKPGTDGTVVISGTPLNTVKLTMNCCDANTDGKLPIEWDVEKTNVDIGFGLLPELNHTSIVSDIGTDEVLNELVRRALTVDPGNFDDLRETCRQITDQTREDTETPTYQQFYMHAVDDQDQPVTDFSFEFSVVKTSKVEDGIARNVVRSENEKAYSATVHGRMSGNVHTHSEDPSFRRLLINVSEIHDLLEEARADIGEHVALAMGVHVPAVDEGIRYDTDNLRNIVIHRTDETPQDRPAFLHPQTTTLIELRINRMTGLVAISQEPQEH